MIKLNQKGVIQFIPLIILLAGIIGGVYLVQHPQILKPKAYDSQVIKITDSSGVTLSEQVSDPNIYLLIQLPKDWQLPNQESKDNHWLIKEAYAQASCPLDNPQEHINEVLIDECDISELSQLSNERLITFPADIFTQLSNARLELFSNEDLIKIGEGSGNLIGFLNNFSNDRLITFDISILSQLASSRKRTFPCNIQSQLGLSCGESSLPMPTQASKPQPSPTENTIFHETTNPAEHVLKELSIKNIDTDNSSGGHEEFSISSNFREYLSKPIYWKLNDLKADQTEAKRVVQLTLFDGKDYFPFTATASLIKAIIPGQGRLLGSADTEYVKWLTHMQSMGIYPAQEDGEIILYNREQFTEKYCSAPPGCILPDLSYAEIITRAESNRDLIGMLASRLYNDGYSPLEVLQSYFPDITPSRLGGIYPTSSQQSNLQTEIDEAILARYIRQIYTEIAPTNKGPLELLVDYSDPIFGTRAIINWLNLPPNKVSDEERLHALLGITIVYGLSEKIAVEGVHLTSSAFLDMAKMIKDIKPIRQSIQRGEAVALRTIKTQADDWVHAGSKLVPKNGLLPKTTGASRFMKGWLTQLTPLINEGKAFVYHPNATRPVMEDLLNAIETWADGALVKRLPRLNRDQIMQTIDNNWIIVVSDEEFIRIVGSRLDAITADRLVLVKQSAASDTSAVLPHEFVHVIANNLGSNSLKNRLLGRTVFFLDQRQADIYGATMSQIYEISTDLVIQKMYGFPSVYQEEYPQLYASMNNLISVIIRQLKGNLSQADFMEFALTGSDVTLMKKILAHMSPEEFIGLIQREIDTQTLLEVMEAQKRSRKALLIAGGIGTATGGLFLSSIYTSLARGQELPEDVTIIYEPPDQDINLIPKDSKDNESFIEQMLDVIF